MNICIYHPNMHLMGGGETVALTLASSLRKTHNVTILITKQVHSKDLEQYFDLPLDGIEFKVFATHITKIPSFRSLKDSLYLRSAYKLFTTYDLVIDTCSNGLFYKKIPQKTICYVHFPNFTKQKKGLKAILNPILINEKEMFCYDTIICNSKFTKKHVQKMTEQKIYVVYPPVKTNKIRNSRVKQKRIVSIGRYSPEKKLDILIDAYKQLNEPQYQLNIIGTRSDEEYLHRLKDQIKGYNIRLYENMPHKDVLRFLENSQIYWHARGFGETDPVEYENFGITTVEAMAAGCIPLVINLGAQPEIVKINESGYCWNTISELTGMTKKCISKNSISKSIIRKRAEFFNTNKFLRDMKKLLFIKDSK